MTKEEMLNAEKLAVARLNKDIGRIFSKSNASAQRTWISADDNFVHIDFIIHIHNSAYMAKAVITLDKSILFSHDCCSKLDARGKIAKDGLSLDELVELRMLRVVFEVCAEISNGY